ncbi:MAG: ATP-binding cassette domain-containing protein [Desulfotignum sp.]|nr:ATP-binding cassette domain-containing protein [Desulfobacteraceae bacterium]
MNIINAKTDHLFIDRFQALPGQAWTILGTNRSGIEDFFDLVAKKPFEGTADVLELPDRLGVVSFAHQQQLFEAELKNDQTDFLDRLDPGTPARVFLKKITSHADLILAFGMTDCLDKGFRQLSTGQARKLMILAQITRGVSCLVIQAPFDGLDTASCTELDQALFHLFSTKLQVLLFVYNETDIPAWTTHLGIVSKGSLIHRGPASRVLSHYRNNQETADFQAAARDLKKTHLTHKSRPANRELIRLHHGQAGYQGRMVFKDLTLVVNKGDHTLVTGPNGSGKSTLLQMITGDHPACYTNDLTVMGIRRGTGESIWDIKQKMGIVSSDLHRNFRVPGSVLSCILSGLFDSIGLYRQVDAAQKKLALEWLERLGMEKSGTVAFRELSYADQRLVLIARALIKSPQLLVLDEPTQGLDTPNRSAVLDFLEEVAMENLATILYVSHREDEFRRFFRQHISMPEPKPETAM